MERVWIILACSFAAAAAVLLLRGRFDGAFVTGALGLVAWFLSLRNRISKANAERENASKLEHNEIGAADED